MMTKSSFLSSIFLLITPFLTYANDTSFGDINGTIILQKNNAISMQHETLFISRDKIKVDYIFKNTTAQDLNIPIAFPMPAMYFGYSNHNEIKDFKVWSNGKPVSFKRNLVILLGEEKKDITQQIKQLGWSEQDLIEILNDDNNYELPNKNPLPDEWFDENKFARFTLNEYFTWTQHFPANTPVYISHTYTPSITTGVPWPVEYLSDDNDYCIDNALKTSAKKIARPINNLLNQEKYVNWAKVSYILTTANNWKDTIEDFHLIIQKKSPSDLVSLCFQGDLIKTDETTFEFRSKNFPPEKDLKILFLSKP